jgi:hypothetical protein
MLGAHPDKCCLVRSFSRGDRLGNKSAVRNDQEPGTYMSYAPPQLAGSRRLGMPTVMERAARRWPIGLAASTRQRAIYAVICLLGQKLVNVEISLQQWRSHRITLHSVSVQPSTIASTAPSAIASATSGSERNVSADRGSGSSSPLAIASSTTDGRCRWIRLHGAAA